LQVPLLKLTPLRASGPTGFTPTFRVSDRNLGAIVFARQTVSNPQQHCVPGAEVPQPGNPIQVI